jgi:hypothetical protein
MNEIEAYVKHGAARRNIDPNLVWRFVVAESNGNPAVRSRGTLRNGQQEDSWGLFQLNRGGGLGNLAEQQGINIRDPNTWKQQTDFTLDYLAKTKDWTPWLNTMNKLGVGRHAGFSGATTTAGPLGAPGTVWPATETGANATSSIDYGDPTSYLPEERDKSPYEDLASTFADAVGIGGSKGLLGEQALAPDQGETKPPPFEYGSAIPSVPPPADAPPPGSLAADASSGTGGLADIFKIGDFGQAGAAIDPMTGLPAARVLRTRRNYG